MEKNWFKTQVLVVVSGVLYFICCCYLSDFIYTYCASLLLALIGIVWDYIVCRSSKKTDNTIEMGLTIPLLAGLVITGSIGHILELTNQHYLITDILAGCSFIFLILFALRLCYKMNNNQPF